MMGAMHAKFKEALTLFNRRDYFHCHEILEGIWLEAATEDKHFYEGLIRLATGLHLRFHRRIPQGAINLLTQGLMRLENYRPTYLGIDVARLYMEIDEHLQDLKASKKTQAGFIERWKTPRIYFED
jgi:predicted metal-dependent hydrolase